MKRAMVIISIVAAFALTVTGARAQDLPILHRGLVYDIYPATALTFPYAKVRRIKVVDHLGGSWYTVVATYVNDGKLSGESPEFYLNIASLTSIFPIENLEDKPAAPAAGAAH